MHVPYGLGRRFQSSLSSSTSSFIHQQPLVRPWRFASTESATSSITLRPYQEEAIQAVLENLRDGKRRLGLSLATGAGKTVIFSQLIGRLQPPTPIATKTLILVHRRELVEQAARHCIQAYPDKNVEIDMGKLQASGQADITVASVMSLTRNDRLKKYDPRKFKLILVDEAHHIVAAGYLQVLKHFSIVREKSTSPPEATAARDSEEISNSPALVGVSATLSRFDGLSLGHAIDHVVYHKDYIDLIDENWLSDVIFSTVKSGANLSKVVSKSGGDFLPGSLSLAVNKGHINETTVKSWMSKAEGRKSTLVFCVDVAHVEALTAKFRELGIDARFVTGKTSAGSRIQLVDAFRKGEFPVLLNVGVFTEGTDIPNIDCVLLARPTKSRNLLVQMIGRGMRLHAGKKDCHVIDMVSALKTGIVTVPTLFGLDPTVLLESANVGEIQRQKQEPAESLQYVDKGLPERLRQSNANIAFKDYDSVADFISDTGGNSHVRKLSTNAWIPVGPDSEGHDRHILGGANKAYLTIKDWGLDVLGRPRFQVTENYSIVTIRDHISATTGARPRTVAKCETFEDAVHAADTYAGKSPRFPRVLRDRQHEWRSKPPTEGQIKLLEKLLTPRGEALDPDQYTGGQCMEMITKLKFGAKGQFDARSHFKARETKKALRQSEMERRETVTVGPLAQGSFGK